METPIGRVFGSSVNHPQQVFHFDLCAELVRRGISVTDFREQLRQATITVNGRSYANLSQVSEICDFPVTCDCESEKGMYISENEKLYEVCEDCWVIHYERGINPQ